MKLSKIVFALFVGLLPVSSYADDTKKPINVGLAAPLTGPYATLGDMMKRGMEIAVEDINASGGVLGHQVNPIEMDDRCDPKEAVNVANKLVNYEVPVVIGHFCSGSSIPTSDIYAVSGIIQISPASTNPKLTQRDIPTIFRVCGRDDAQGLTTAQWLSKYHPDKTVAVVHDKQTYSKGLADSFRTNAEKIGKNKIVLQETVNPGEKDFSSLITKVKQSKADVIYYGGYHSELGQIIRQLSQQGIKPLVISGDAIGTNELWQITGEAGQGTLFTQGSDPTQVPEAAPLIEKLNKKNYPLEMYSFYTYGAIQAWVQAVEKAGTFDSMKVAQIMKSAQFNTVMGTLGFDEKGDIKGSAYRVYEWRDGKFFQLPE